MIEVSAIDPVYCRHMDGILPVHKPRGISTYDVIRALKRAGYRGKVGHGGTLDPFAEGVVLLLLGKSTTKFGDIQKLRKRYVAEAVTGAKSDTLDRDGKVEKVGGRVNINESKIQDAANKYVGEINQKVPAYSAAKHRGRPLYKLAREGKKIPEKYKIVTIYSMKVEVKNNIVTFDVECSTGTYIRQLSYDILKSVGVMSYLDSLVRVSIGTIGLDDCIKVDDFATDEWDRYLVGDERLDMSEGV